MVLHVENIHIAEKGNYKKKKKLYGNRSRLTGSEHINTNSVIF